MDFAELSARVAALPGVTPSVLGRLLAFSPEGRADDIGYILVPRAEGGFVVLLGDGRGSAAPAPDEHGAPIVFVDEDAACRWILDRIERTISEQQRSAAPAVADDAAAAANRADQERRVRERIAQLKAQQGGS
jgi:hypothetical protein